VCDPTAINIFNHMIKGPWSPKLTYTFYPFSWKCWIFW